MPRNINLFGKMNEGHHMFFANIVILKHDTDVQLGVARISKRFVSEIGKVYDVCTICLRALCIIRVRSRVWAEVQCIDH